MNAELAELQDAARQVLDAAGLAAEESQSWPLVLELGWLLVALPEAQGGLGQGLAGACALLTETGRGLCAAPYLPALLAVDAVGASGLPQRADWLERLTTRELATAPLSEASLQFTGSDREGWRVDGHAAAVPSADRADHVLACAADGAVVALLPLPESRAVPCERPGWDRTRRLFDLRFEQLPVGPERVLAHGAPAVALCRRIATFRDFAVAADAIGGAAALLEATIDYLGTRRQFGRPLALFQALKHRCADLKVQISAAQALMLDGIEQADRAIDGVDAALRGRAAKSLACAAYARVAEEALQLHGGIGMTAEHPCHLFLKRALLNEQLGRNAELDAQALAGAFLESA